MDDSKLDPNNPSLLEVILPHKRTQYQQYREELYIKFWKRSVGLRQGSMSVPAQKSQLVPLQSSVACKAVATCSARVGTFVYGIACRDALHLVCLLAEDT
jgi:hypothetical protein